MENTEEEWGLFIDELWALQWTNINTPLTVTLSDRLYELSVGNMDLAVRIFTPRSIILLGLQMKELPSKYWNWEQISQSGHQSQLRMR